MPKTITTTLYEYSELGDVAKDKAAGQLLDINTDHEWWDCIYDNAVQLGCEITAFDIGYRQSIDLVVKRDSGDIWRGIVKEWGPGTELGQLATEFGERFAALHLLSTIADFMDIDDNSDWMNDYDSAYNELSEYFDHELKCAFLAMLSSEYEYLTSEDAIIETIEANDYWFTESGELA
jgi:hypothetical protein